MQQYKKKINFLEKDLHKFLSYYAYYHLHCYTKTIKHQISSKNEFGEWVHPDMVGCYFSLDDWKKEVWNFFFVGGILIGAFLATRFLTYPEPVKVAPALLAELKSYGIEDHSKVLPRELFSLEGLFTLRGLIMLVGGGFLVGFGARYAGGCTSGHAIMGISDLQVPSMIATASFMTGGFLMANVILPFILKL